MHLPPAQSVGQSPAEAEETQWLVREAIIGFTQLESGQIVTVDSKEEFLRLFMSRP